MTVTTTAAWRPLRSLATTSKLLGPSSRRTVVRKQPAASNETTSASTLTKASATVQPATTSRADATTLSWAGSVTLRKNGLHGGWVGAALAGVPVACGATGAVGVDGVGVGVALTLLPCITSEADAGPLAAGAAPPLWHASRRRPASHGRPPPFVRSFRGVNVPTLVRHLVHDLGVISRLAEAAHPYHHDLARQ